MKKIMMTAFLATAMLCLFTQCQKDHHHTRNYFYVNQPETGSKLKLYVDDQYRGELPYIDIGSTAECNYIKEHALEIPIYEKHFKVEAKDTNGVVIASATLKHNMHCVEVTGSAGTVGVAQSKSVVIVDFAGDKTSGE